MEPKEVVGGYHETLLVDPPSVLCTLCFKFPRDPKQCSVCKSIYCVSEIDQKTFECLVCANKTTEQLDHGVFTAYINTLMFCSICSTVMIFKDYSKHPCFLTPCWNREICGKKDIEKSPLKAQGACSPACFLIKMKKESKSDKEILTTITQLIKKFGFKGPND